MVKLHTLSSDHVLVSCLEIQENKLFLVLFQGSLAVLAFGFKISALEATFWKFVVSLAMKRLPVVRSTHCRSARC